ncbi:hypothetical protein ROZALSC1DRAFT_28806 [Rozella allomycis CSF55]|uniref:NAD(P)-binding protein n=1 Tax=Rozella allomycis (strain CSF55) TaxID=988480 RepID=A0A4P9YL52_ROZAC|nr:hypothetical protein ROZALSC1DRAFT_28806 [Rozella allomycis CSF55]
MCHRLPKLGSYDKPFTVPSIEILFSLDLFVLVAYRHHFPLWLVYVIAEKLTGASKGIGRAITETFLTENDIFVHGTYNSSEPWGEHERLRWYHLNLSDKISIERTSKKLNDFFIQKKELCALINNAGVARDRLLIKEDYDSISFYLSGQRNKSIINISSIVGTDIGNIGQVCYGASKAGICGMTL